MNIRDIKPGMSVTTANEDGHLETTTVIEAGVRRAVGMNHGNRVYVAVRNRNGDVHRIHANRVFPAPK